MSRTRSSKIIISTLIGAVVVLGQAVSPAFAQPATPTVIPAPMTTAPTILPNTVIQAVKQAASKRFDVPVGQLNVVDARQQMWPDGCLGLGDRGVFCTQAIVPGWRVPITDGIQTWVYRTDAQGTAVKLEDAEKARLSVPIASKLVQRVARENRVPVSSLRVTEVRSPIFDGCLGLYRPNQQCTEIAIPGWQVVVRGAQQSWVYHLNEQATRIERNGTASGAGWALRVTFDEWIAERPALDSTIVFRSTVSGGFAGIMTQVVLTTDGKVTEYSSSPLARIAPKVIKTLSPEQVAAFKQMLETERYPNLNGLNYLTEMAVADVPGTMFESQLGVVQYINLEQYRLPRSLRQVIRVWEDLIRVNNPV
jgi:hypothetical protein